MEGIEGLKNILADISTVLPVLNFLLVIAVLFYTLYCGSKIKKLRNKYNRLINGVHEGNIEEILMECIERVNKVELKNRELDTRINILEHRLASCIQKVGIVRFNAFEDTGSDLSFAIALLNENDDGVVLSSIFSRESSYTYAKPVIAGNSKYPLSAEEIKAIDLAKRSGKTYIYV